MDYPRFEAPSPRFLSALGAVTLNWAAIEAALDFATAIIFHEYRHDKMEREIPRALERKISFLRDGVKHADLAKIHARAEKLLCDLLAEKDGRHTLVHGAILGAPDRDSVEVLRIKYTKTKHRSSVQTITSPEIEACAERALALSDRATAFSVRLYNITRPKDAFDYPLGEFSG
jgi:hypothetical protein